MLELNPEAGVPIPPVSDDLDLHDRVAAACESLDLLEAEGLEVLDGTTADALAAAKVAAAYAADPATTSKAATPANIAGMTPAALRHVRDYLDEFGRSVVTHAVELRHLVTNRLLEESQNPDPRIRIRALELLGKISDVGLFSEKQEVTITHKTTDELRERLRGKLQKLVKKPDSIPLDGDIIDVDAELGLNMPDNPSNTSNISNKDVYVPEWDDGEGA